MISYSKKNKNIGLNAILNVIKTSLSIMFPLVTYPYALRIIGATGMGKVSFGASIISYFSLFAMLGVNSYGVREGAKLKDNKEAFNEFARQIFTINICTTFISYCALGIFVVASSKLYDYRLLIALQSISIILTTVGVDWINVVYEDYLLITVRSIITHVISFILLFVFVKEPDDYYLYALLSVCTNGIICISNLIHCRRYLKIGISLKPNLKKHLRPLIILFANTIAIQIYVNFDNTMIGWIKGDYFVGLYTVSVKIYTILKTIMAAIYSVSLSRLSYYIGNGKLSDYKKLYTDIWGYLSLLLVPASAGLIAVSDEIIIFMGGQEIIDAKPSLIILSLSLIFAIFGGLITACLNITIHKEKDNLIATVIGAIINCGLNLVLIPMMAQNGAAITTLLSEAFVFVFCFVRIKDRKSYIDFKKIFPSLVHSFLGAFAIIMISIIVHNLIDNLILSFILIVILGIISYMILLLVCKDKYFYAGKQKIFTLFKRRIGNK